MSNSGQSRKPALILNRIVQQGSYRLILVAASLKDKGAYAHQVGNVGDRDALSGLLMMKAGGELQCEVKSPSQEGRILFHDLNSTTACPRRWLLHNVEFGFGYPRGASPDNR